MAKKKKANGLRFYNEFLIRIFMRSWQALIDLWNINTRIEMRKE